MTVREIPLVGWKREKLFRSYIGADLPYIIIGARMDVTNLLAYCRHEKLSFYFTLVNACTRVADSIENFRWRFEGERVFEIAYNRPVLTHIRPGETDFIMVEGPHTDDPRAFDRAVRQSIAACSDHTRLDTDDLSVISFSCIPWIDYTHFIRTIMHGGADCNPKMSWGKYITENGRTSLTLSVQTHHGLMDGYHVGLFYKRLQRMLDAFPDAAML